MVELDWKRITSKCYNCDYQRDGAKKCVLLGIDLTDEIREYGCPDFKKP